MTRIIQSRRRTGIETFVERCNQKRQRPTKVGPIAVNLTVTASDVLTDDVIAGIRAIIRSEIFAYHEARMASQRRPM